MFGILSADRYGDTRILVLCKVIIISRGDAIGVSVVFEEAKKIS